MKATSAETETRSREYLVPQDPLWPEKMKKRSMTYLKKYDSCTQSILWAFMEELSMENRMALRAGGAMQGGMMSSLTCGVHTAGLMILGMLVGRERLESGLDGMMPIIMPAQRLVKKLTGRIGGHSCFEMTGVDFTDLEAAMIYKLSGDHERCVDRIGDGARIIAELLQDLDRRGELFRV
ncbi:C-GCAxxG-C-C family protein [Thermodesulfobacteriota bacterium]